MEKQTHYYLIGNEIKKGEAKPYQANVMRTNPVFAEAEDILYKEWFNSLQPCSVTDVELEKVINGICKLYAIEGIDVSQPIEVTELITDNDGVVTFRGSKSEANEVVLFAEWILCNYNTSETDFSLCWKDCKYKTKHTTTELYEIFKTRNNK